MRTTSSNSLESQHSTLAGSGKYFRFTVRHNLVRYLVWIAVVVGMLVYVTVFYKSEQKSNPHFLDQFANITQAGGMSAMIGKINVISIAGAVWSKIWMFLAMMLAIGMVFQVTKGMRADEENGRTELFRSRPFGIHSTLTAVVSGALLLCAVIGILSMLCSIGLGLDPAGAGITGSVVFGLSIIACGWFGVGVGALTNQLSASASLANTTGSVVIVAFYVLRMIGDMGNNTIIWISPIGWAERMAPWAENRGWLIIPAIVLTAILISIALVIESRRDYGAGVLREKSGKADATLLLRQSWGLVLHLYKGTIIVWSVGMVLAGLMFGSVAKQVLDLVSNSKLAMLKGSGMDALLGFLLVFLGLIAMVLPLQIMTGLRSDEAKGLTESQLSGGMSRYRLILERVVISCCALVLLLLLGGVSMGASYGVVAKDMSQAWKLALAALAYLPGILAVMGIAVLLFGFFPRATIPVTWFLYGVMYFDVLFGDTLKLPNWVSHIMPFTGTPRMPYEDFNASVFGFAAAAIVLIALGLIGLRKRDIPQ